MFAASVRRRARVALVVSALIATTTVGVVAAPAASAAGAVITSTATTKAGGSVTIGGSGWPAYASINMYLVGSSSTYICTVYANSTGAVPAQACTVSTSFPYGVYTVHGDDGTGQAANATQTLTITPALGVNSTFSNQPTVRSAAGETLSLSAHGLPALTGITSVKVGTTTVTTTPASPSTDTNGTVTGVSFMVPTAQAAGGTTVTVTAGGRTASMALAVFRPAISAAASLRVGTPIAVGGTGWPANDSINVYLVSSTGNTYFCSVYSTDTGGLPAQQCTIPTGLPINTYQLELSDNGVNAAQAIVLTPAVALTNAFSNQPSHNVAAGGSLIIGGHGFTAVSTISTVKVGATVVATTPASPATDTTGAFSAVAFTVPATTAAGGTSVTATDAGSHSGSIHLTVYRASMAAPGTAKAGQPITMHGGGWPANDSINVYLQSSTATTYFCGIYSDDTGNVAAQTCSIPTWAAAGSDSLVFSDNQVVLKAPFTVTSAISLTDPTSGEPTVRVAAGQSVVVAGHGFTPSTAISSVKIGSVTLAMTPASTNTDGNGTFSGIGVTIPTTQAAGTAVITVTDAAARSGTLTVQVFRPTVTAPTSAAANTSMVLSGGGWPAMDSVYAYLEAGTSRTYFCAMYTDDLGNFTPQNCTIPYNLPNGSYTLQLTDQTVTITKAFTVTASLVAENISNSPIGGASAGTTINLVGHGFTASSAIHAKLGTTALTTTPAAPSTDTNGDFSSVSFVVPTIAKGTYTLTVTDGASHSASVQFVVQ
jgi:hypothetical protein